MGSHIVVVKANCQIRFQVDRVTHVFFVLV